MDLPLAEIYIERSLHKDIWYEKLKNSWNIRVPGKFKDRTSYCETLASSIFTREVEKKGNKEKYMAKRSIWLFVRLGFSWYRERKCRMCEATE